MSRERRLAVFDFDCTITRADSMVRFLWFSFGMARCLWGTLLCTPWIVGYFLRLTGGHCAKQRVLSHFLKGMPLARFEALCTRFAAASGKIIRPTAMQAIVGHLRQGDAVVVLTASVEQWVAPFFAGLDVTVVGTRLEVDCNGMLTGRLLTPNCYGAEKCRRLRAALTPALLALPIEAYGDSRGDRELLDAAKWPHYREFQ